MIKRAIIIALVLNSFIMIGIPAGHGYGIMIMFEVISIPSLIKNGIEFTDEYPFGDGIILIGLISLIGKIILIISLFYKNLSDKKFLIYGGLGLLLTAFTGAVLGAWNYDPFLFAITFGSGIPFLMYAGRLIYLMNKKDDITELKAD